SAGNDVLIAGEMTGTYQYQVNYLPLAEFNGQAWKSNGMENARLLRAIGSYWAALHAADTDLASGSDDVVDTTYDQLTGGSGADWFIVNVSDKVTDANPIKDGDYIEFV